MYRRRSSHVLYFILFYESVHQSDFIKSVLCLYKSVLLYIELILEIWRAARACIARRGGASRRSAQSAVNRTAGAIGGVAGGSPRLRITS